MSVEASVLEIQKMSLEELRALIAAREGLDSTSRPCNPFARSIEGFVEENSRSEDS